MSFKQSFASLYIYSLSFHCTCLTRFWRRSIVIIIAIIVARDKHQHDRNLMFMYATIQIMDII